VEMRWWCVSDALFSSTELSWWVVRDVGGYELS
jgi:hypothetical protein